MCRLLMFHFNMLTEIPHCQKKNLVNAANIHNVRPWPLDGARSFIYVGLGWAGSLSYSVELRWAFDVSGPGQGSIILPVHSSTKC